MESNKQIKNALARRDADNSLRTLKRKQFPVDFCSNDYLGIAQDEQFRKDFSQKDLGKIGSGGSRLLAGNYQQIEELESYIAQLYRTEAALFFNSGYNANLSIFSAIPQKGDTIIYDELSHACIKDGARLSLARRLSFKHNDLDDLERKLTKATGEVYVAAESIYSMDGDYGALEKISKRCENRGAFLVVDEAHSTGIMGDKGEGYCVTNHIKAWCRIHTFGKAIGSHGACVVGSPELKEYLINFARPFIYTTSLPQHSIIMIHEALKYCETLSDRRTQLQSHIYLFKSLINVPLIESDSPIQAVLIPGVRQVKKVSEMIQNQGFDVRPVLSPTVKEGTERIRVCLHSYNTEREIKDLVKLLNESV